MDNWCTPPEVADPLADFFGGPVDIDPCSNPVSIIQARRAFYTGGLILPWELAVPVDRTCWLNEPYSAPRVWQAKLFREMDARRVMQCVRLTMMDTSTEWWEQMCGYAKFNPRIIATRRLSFLAEDGAKRESCRHAPALIYFGDQPDRFTRAFKHIARWTTWGR